MGGQFAPDSPDVFNLFSKIIYTTTFNCKRKELDLSEFDAGMYYVRISNLNCYCSGVINILTE
jgi:hypothetical protein